MPFYILNIELPEVIHEVLPNTMKTETALRHFRDGFILRPPLDHDAIDRTQ